MLKLSEVKNMMKQIIKRMTYKEYIPVMMCAKFEKDCRQLQRKQWYK